MLSCPPSTGGVRGGHSFLGIVTSSISPCRGRERGAKIQGAGTMCMIPSYFKNNGGNLLDNL